MYSFIVGEMECFVKLCFKKKMTLFDLKQSVYEYETTCGEKAALERG